MAERTVVLPATTAEASALLASAARESQTVVPRGAGLGWRVPDADMVLDLTAMDKVTEHTAGDLVASVQAGARAGELARTLTLAGQRLSLDVPPDVTVGGMIANGLAGPLRFRYGSPRDLLIGITVVRPDGVVARSGGKVVKNVAGYDLGKLFAGSRGTLGVITEATFRLHPLPQAVAYLTATSDAAGAVAAVAAAANSPMQPSAVELDWSGDAFSVGVLLEGTRAGVAERASRMTGLLGVPADTTISDSTVSDYPISLAAPAWWGRLPAARAVVRVTFWLSRLGAVLDAIASAGVACTVRGSAGAGVLNVCLDGDAAPVVAALRAATGNRGSVAALTDPWEPDDPLMRAVRDQFDPEHRMRGGA
jgi:glycolate oxidase FAD binding subunit